MLYLNHQILYWIKLFYLCWMFSFFFPASYFDVLFSDTREGKNSLWHSYSDRCAWDHPGKMFSFTIYTIYNCQFDIYFCLFGYVVWNSYFMAFLYGSRITYSTNIIWHINQTSLILIICCFGGIIITCLLVWKEKK